MKKALFMMSMLLSLGMFSACSSDGEMDVIGGGDFLITDSAQIPDDGVVLNPIEMFNEWNLYINEEVQLVSCFLNEQLPVGKRSDSFFIGLDKDRCYVINSIQELKNIYYGERDLPKLDFNKYTLVIGQKVMPDFYYPVFKQELEFRDHQCLLNLHVPDFDPGYKPLQHFYYWALYPKFYTAGISVNYIKEKSVLKHVEDLVGYLGNGKSSKNPLGVYYIGGSGVYEDYFPINLPDDFAVDKVTRVKFSGEYIDMTDNLRFALHLPYDGSHYRFIYLTKIEVAD